MKKSLSLLAVAGLVLSAATSYAEVITLRPYVSYIESPTVSEVIAPGATLVNTQNGNVVVYDLSSEVKIEPPFDITQGLIVWGFNLADEYNTPNIKLEDIAVTEGDSIVLDFSTRSNRPLGGPVDAEYLVLMFHSQTTSGNDFAEWYSQNNIPIIARFTNGDYVAYAIDDTCDREGSGNSSTYGGLVFFNMSVQDDVTRAEVDPDAVPEPTTATLSLLALAGLAARRRRK